MFAGLERIDGDERMGTVWRADMNRIHLRLAGKQRLIIDINPRVRRAEFFFRLDSSLLNKIAERHHLYIGQAL